MARLLTKQQNYMIGVFSICQRADSFKLTVPRQIASRRTRVTLYIVEWRLTEQVGGKLNLMLRL